MVISMFISMNISLKVFIKLHQIILKKAKSSSFSGGHIHPQTPPAQALMLAGLMPITPNEKNFSTPLILSTVNTIGLCHQKILNNTKADIISTHSTGIFIS